MVIYWKCYLDDVNLKVDTTVFVDLGNVGQMEILEGKKLVLT